MVLSEKHQKPDGYCRETDAKKWVIAGISVRSQLRAIATKPSKEREILSCESEVEDEEECCTTPKAAEARIPEKLRCPPPPRKRRPGSKCGHFNRDREFFNPPDLETVFGIRHVERAN